MSRLTIIYDYSGFVFFDNAPMNVSVDGLEHFVLEKGASHEMELKDGSYTLHFSSMRCRKTLHLHLDGDDSFYVTWDRFIGGITVVDSFDERAAAHSALRRRAWTIAAIFFASFAALLVLKDRESITSNEFYLGLLLIVGSIAILVIAVLEIRSKDITR